MQINKTRFGFLGSLVLGASVLTQGCSKKSEYEKVRDEISTASVSRDYRISN